MPYGRVELHGRLRSVFCHITTSLTVCTIYIKLKVEGYHPSYIYPYLLVFISINWSGPSYQHMRQRPGCIIGSNNGLSPHWHKTIIHYHTHEVDEVISIKNNGRKPPIVGIFGPYGAAIWPSGPKIESNRPTDTRTDGRAGMAYS